MLILETLPRGRRQGPPRDTDTATTILEPILKMDHRHNYCKTLKPLEDNIEENPGKDHDFLDKSVKDDL